MIGTVGIKNLRIPALIGCYDVEKGRKQELIISLKGNYDISEILKNMHLKDTGEYEHLGDAIDYCALKELCEKTLKESFPLVEMLAYKLQQNILAKFPEFLTLKVKVKKPHAFRGQEYPYILLSWER